VGVARVFDHQGGAVAAIYGELAETLRRMADEGAGGYGDGKVANRDTKISLRW
jgi:hypothetical protein